MKKLLFVFLSLFICLKSYSQEVIEVKNPVIIREQGIIQYNDGDYQTALEYFNKINYQKDEKVLLLMSNCYDSLGDMDKALDFIGQAETLNPENQYIHYNKALILYKKNDLEQAINYFEKATKTDKNFGEAFYNLGYCYFKNNELKKAENAFEKAEKLLGDNENIKTNLTLIYEKQGKPQKAKRFAKKENKQDKPQD